jgi:hypothetical protein
MPPLRTIILSTILLLISLITLAHLHPSTPFQVPYIPTLSPSIHPTVDLTPPPLTSANNRQLTHQQCLDTYPELYLEADRARDWYKRKGGISAQDLEDAGWDEGASARIAIIGNQVGVFVRTSKEGV